MLMILALALSCLTVSVNSQQSFIAAAPPPPAPPPVRNTCRGGFTVRKADTRSLRTGSKVAFQDVLTNMGGWSSSSNDFSAPCSGVYFFTFHAVSPERGDFTVALMKGNTYQVTAYGTNSDYQQGSNSAILYLNKGETVHLELQQGTIYEHPFNEAYTTFTGFLVNGY